MMPTRSCRHFVLRIEHQREHGGIGADRARNGIETPADVCSSR
jgi:hypothetical protein